MPIESGWSRTSTDGKWINLNTKSQVNNTIPFSVATLESKCPLVSLYVINSSESLLPL